MRSQKFLNLAGVVSIVFIFAVFLFSAPEAFALTLVDGDIAEDATWTKEQSPYVVTGYTTILPGTVLTVEPGVTVKFMDGASLFFNDSNLDARGTETDPIYFTSWYDDEIGGDADDQVLWCDTDADGNVIDGTCEMFDPGDPIAGDWGGLDFDGSDSSILENVIFRYADRTVNMWDFSQVDFKNLEVRDSVAGLAIYMGSRSEIQGGVFENLDRDALAIYMDSSLDIKNINISNIEYSAISVFMGSSLTAENVNFKNIALDSGWPDALDVFNGSSLILKNSLFENCPDSCLDVFDGDDYLDNPSDVDITGTIFNGGRDNGIEIYSNSNLSIDINSSSFEGFNHYAIEQYGNPVVRAENNWWGDPSGPQHDPLNLDGLGEAIYGNVDFEPWCESEDCSSRNPILIIPGLLGTEIFNGTEKLWMDLTRTATNFGDQFLDVLAFKDDLTPINNGLSLGDIIKTLTVDILISTPIIFDYSGSLVEEFNNQGYVEGIDLFTFPYDWRYGEDEINIQSLKQKITDIVLQTGKNKVDVIAHSNGGLLFKKYAMENPTEHHVSKAVFVGVPNTGAPKAIKALILGDSFGNPFLSPNEMKKLARNFPVAYDLLPSQQYYDSKGSYVRVIEDRLLNPDEKDLNFEETNEFLLDDYNLNAQALTQAQALHTQDFDNYDLRTAGIDPYNIVGCKAGTIGKIIKRQTETALGGTKISYVELGEIPGDGTVPLESATNLPVDEAKRFFALESSHATMLTQNGIRQQIVNILSGSELSTTDGNNELITQDINECKLNGWAIAIYSPISIDITDQNDNHLGLSSDGVSTENNIPNADFEIMGEQKFVYLPKDDSLVYDINFRGIGIGTFTITNAEIENNQIIEEKEFIDIPVTTQTRGEIILNSETQDPELRLDVTGDGKNDFIIKPSDTFDPVLYLQIMKTTINSLNLPLVRKLGFNMRVDRIIKMIQKGKIDRAKLKADRFKSVLERRIERPDSMYPRLKKMSKADAELLLDMLNKLLDNLS